MILEADRLMPVLQERKVDADIGTMRETDSVVAVYSLGLVCCRSALRYVCTVMAFDSLLSCFATAAAAAAVGHAAAAATDLRAFSDGLRAALPAGSFAGFLS